MVCVRFMSTAKHDIDNIIAEVHVIMPEVRVIQTHKPWPAYDENVWRFIAERGKEIQLESRSASLPFVVKPDDSPDSEISMVTTVPDAVTVIVGYFRSVRPLTKACGECGSLYLADSSQMCEMCPQCSTIIFGYDPCNHVFVDGRCSLCYWDGSASRYIKRRLKSMGLKWKRTW